MSHTTSISTSGLSLHLTTFNCGREEIHIDYFASSLYTSLPTASFLPPEILVLCLQEIAPLGFAFLGGSLLTPYLGRFEKAVRKALEWMYGGSTAEEYGLLVTRNVGLTGMMVFVRGEGMVKWVQAAEVGCGFWEMGNKGAVGIRLGLESDGKEEVVTFVSAHLAPMEEAWQRRNEDWEAIVRRLVFEDVEKTIEGRKAEAQPLLPKSSTKRRENGTLFSPASHIFFAGDLNYRTSNTQPDAQKDFQSWPQPTASSSDPTHFTNLLKKDQLTRERQKGRTLHNLAEEAITFPPTYKYSSKAMSLAVDHATQHKAKSKNVKGDEPAVHFSEDHDSTWLWAKHRIPSWCDRILYLAASPPKTVHSYTALPIQPTSDHRPVALSCQISDKTPKEIEAPFKIDESWKEKREKARTYELVVGIGAYLTLTGQGEALLAGTIVGLVGGYFVLTALLGNV